MKLTLYRMVTKGVALFLMISVCCLNVTVSFAASQDVITEKDNGPEPKKEMRVEGELGKEKDLEQESSLEEGAALTDTTDTVIGTQTKEQSETAEVEQTEVVPPVRNVEGSKKVESATGVESTAEEVTDEMQKPLEPVPIETDPRVEITESEDGLTMIYVGAGVGAAVLLAAALGGSSSSSSDSDVSYTDPTVDLVGPSIYGNDWSGYIDLKDHGHEGYQTITATVTQNGSAVQIDTTSTMDYGNRLNGTINSSGHMLLYDSVTGEDWSTFKGNAQADKIDLYDWVNHLGDLDQIYLTR